MTRTVVFEVQQQGLSAVPEALVLGGRTHNAPKAKAAKKARKSRL
jgi:hypothetical protein